MKLPHKNEPPAEKSNESHRHAGVYPRFYWKAPPEVREYWSVINGTSPRMTEHYHRYGVDVDNDITRKHPTLRCVVYLSAFVLCMIPFLFFYIHAERTGSENPFLLGFGILGSLGAGFGLFNIAMAWLHLYLGHWITILCLLGGGGITAVCWLLM